MQLPERWSPEEPVAEIQMFAGSKKEVELSIKNSLSLGFSSNKRKVFVLALLATSFAWVIGS